MQRTGRQTLGAALLLLLGSPAMACYTVYNRANQMVYHAAAAPVNMSYQLHQTLPSLYPGGHLLFSITDTDCPLVNQTRSNSIAVSALPSRGSYLTRPGETAPPGPGIRSYTIVRP